MNPARDVRVKVATGARKEKFEEVKDGVFAVSVREKAEQNAANERVCALLARHFKVPVKAVRIASGHHAQNKRISVIK